MTLLTTSELETHLETDLPDAALQRVLDAAERKIIDVAGANPGTSITEQFTFPGFPSGQTRTLYPARKFASITSIDEREYFDETATTLSANDYETVGGRRIVRLHEGDNSRLLWAPIVDVTYTPIDDSALRRAVQVDLCKIALNFSGYSNERIGDVNLSSPNLRDSVSAALQPLRGGRNGFPVR